MQTVAVTETGIKTNMVWFNDYETRESRLVHAGHLTEILGITQEELEECGLACSSRGFIALLLNIALKLIRSTQLN